MEGKKFELNDIVKMKKQHPCGTNSWEIIRIGADIRIKCQGCQHSVIMPRNDFIKRIKKVEKLKEELKSSKIPQGKEHSFSWPSTFAQETQGVLEDKVPYKSESKLMKYGYRITDLTREQRWEILTGKVLKNLPLNQIAGIIASHIRNRKRQKNGATVYKFAINEWKHDLNRLKKEYYKSDFTWPSV